MKKTIFAAAVAAALAATPLAALAAGAVQAPTKTTAGWMQESERDEALHLTPNKENGKEIYEVCSACHQLNGWGLPDGTFPEIAHQHRLVCIKQLSDIRAGNRDNPTMYPFALPSEIGGVQAIADVCEYIRHLPLNPENGVGPGDDLAHGEKLYKENCVRCHGANGEGDDAKYYPRIHAQHYNYLVRQYNWIKEGKRRNANPDMVEQIKWMTEKDTKAVLDYVSRMKPPKEIVAPKDWENPDFK